MLETLKGWAVKIIAIIAVITALLFIIMGPSAAADFIIMIRDTVSSWGSDGKILIEQVKNG